MDNLKMAWRNLWRNRRRTLITSASIFFAVFFALLMRSIQLGTYDHMYKNAIESYSGYLQVQHPDYWDEKIIDNSISYDPELEKALLGDENLIAAIPRLESFALASNGPQTKGVLVMGVDPLKEKYLSAVSNRLVRFQLSPENIQKIERHERIPGHVKELLPLFEGAAYSSSGRLQLDLAISDQDSAMLMPLIREYCAFDNGHIRMGEPGVWAGFKLSEYLGLGIGDTLVLIGQGYHGSTAAGKYPIRGIVKMPLPDLDNKIVYLPLDICQALYSAEGRISSLAFALNEHQDRDLLAAKAHMSPLLPDDHRLMDWKEMNEVMISQMEADNQGGMIMLGILYLVIAFGVFGTVLMLTAERKREFGVLVAIGMQKRKLAAIMSYEMLLIGLLGILAGAVVATMLILYGVGHPLVFKGEMALMFEDYGFEPMLAFWKIDSYYLWQSFIVALMVLLAILYPMRKIFLLKVVNALRA